MRIVIVEDEIRIREGIVHLLGKLDASYEVAGEAENGEDGLRTILQQKPDLIITDVKMPVMDGIEMMRRLREVSCQAEAVVLSAYSEFVFAQQAMKEGVCEYLVKPIQVDELRETLDRVRRRLEEKEKLAFENPLSLTHILSAQMNSSGELPPWMHRHLADTYQISDDTNFAILVTYLGDSYGACVDEMKTWLHAWLKAERWLCHRTLPLLAERSLLTLFWDFEEEGALLSMLEERLVPALYDAASVEPACGYRRFASLTALRQAYDALSALMDYAIVLPPKSLVHGEVVSSLPHTPVMYPFQIEKSAKVALYAYRFAEMDMRMDDFYHLFTSGTLYTPHEVKECFIRFLWAILSTAKELGFQNANALERQALLTRVTEARTGSEMRLTLRFLLEELTRAAPKGGEQPISLLVQRARDMAQEFYRQGITLDEIAQKLAVTPEYLGTQFHQELGMTYGAYMKRLRMEKAKELLIKTDKKLYQIANMLGYSDAKYFSRVFKTMTGMMPVEYRRAHK